MRKLKKKTFKLAEAGHSISERSYLLNRKVPGEAANVDVEAAASSPDLVKIVDGDGYTKEQIFNGDETALNWKMSCSTFIGRDEKSMLGFETSKDRLTLVRG